LDTAPVKLAGVVVLLIIGEVKKMRKMILVLCLISMLFVGATSVGCTKKVDEKMPVKFDK
jgi:hypothetical protein